MPNDREKLSDLWEGTRGVGAGPNARFGVELRWLGFNGATAFGKINPGWEHIRAGMR